MCKNPAKKNLKWDGQNNEYYYQESTPAEVQVDKIGDHTQVEGGEPKHMRKQECLWNTQKNNETSFKHWGRRDELYMTSDLPVQIFEHRLKLGWQCDQSRAYQWSPDSATVSISQRKKYSKSNTLRVTVHSRKTSRGPINGRAILGIFSPVKYFTCKFFA